MRKIVRGEDWENVCQQCTTNTAYKDFIQTSTYCSSQKKVNINKQKIDGSHLESVNLVKN
jgi:hypothetical protein